MNTTESKEDKGSELSSNLMKLPTDADSNIKSDPKESDTESKEDSLANMIASVRKELFKVTPPAGDNDNVITLVATAKSKKWVPINKAKDRTMTLPATTTNLKRRGATFAADTNFKEREGQPTKMTPAKAQDGIEEMKECVAQLRIKIHAGAEDIQETVLGLMLHCLSIFHERDKTACFVNTAKSLEAKKLTDLPQDFTDFHNDWGKWDEPMKSFLSTMPKDKGRSFTGSFYFRSTWEPEKLFEKTLLKMAGPTKLKGTITIGVMPISGHRTSRHVL